MLEFLNKNICVYIGARVCRLSKEVRMKEDVFRKKYIKGLILFIMDYR